jgi:hypothetical protein
MREKQIHKIEVCVADAKEHKITLGNVDLEIDLICEYDGFKSRVMEESEAFSGGSKNSVDRRWVAESMLEEGFRDDRLWAGCMLRCYEDNPKVFWESIDLLVDANRRHPECATRTYGMELLRAAIGNVPRLLA